MSLVVHNEVLNNSNSHQKFSFGKDARFKNTLTPVYLDIESGFKNTKHARAASFGIGSRPYLLRNKIGLNTGPDCTTYNLPSDFDNKPRYSTPTINKAGRNAFQKVIFPDTRRSQVRIGESQIPGPGAYTNKVKTIGTEGLKFSLHPRINQTAQCDREKPGPGSYNIDHVQQPPDNQTGSTKCHLYRLPIKRIKNLKIEKPPGPGQYSPKMQSIVRITKLYRGDRKLLGCSASKDTMNIPGPGLYRLPSDFGHLIQPTRVHARRNAGMSRSNTDMQGTAQDTVRKQETTLLTAKSRDIPQKQEKIENTKP